MLDGKQAMRFFELSKEVENPLDFFNQLPRKAVNVRIISLRKRGEE